MLQTRIEFVFETLCLLLDILLRVLFVDAVEVVALRCWCVSNELKCLFSRVY